MHEPERRHVLVFCLTDELNNQSEINILTE